MKITPHLMAIGGYNLFAGMAGAKPKKPDSEFLRRFINAFNHDIRGKRNAALFVDLDGELSVPSKEICQDDARDMISIVNAVLKDEPVFLRASGDNLQRALGVGFLPLSTLDQRQLFKQIGKLFLRNDD